jgi:membrane-associated PAP2 superfamily phosphatase
MTWPRADLIVSGWFYRPGQGFYLADQPLLVFLHGVAYYGARVLGAGLAVAALVAVLRRKPLFSISAKGWLFLFLALLLAPGLVGNALFKDQWGRARPHEVTEFGGAASFSPALLPQPEAHRNGSFIAGDAAFGFYLTAFAYVLPTAAARRRALRVGMLAGILLGLARIMMGAHFLSDVVFAGFFMLTTIAALHAAMYGPRETRLRWREWLK